MYVLCVLVGLHVCAYARLPCYFVPRVCVDFIADDDDGSIFIIYTDHSHSGYIPYSV